MNSNAGVYNSCNLINDISDKYNSEKIIGGLFNVKIYSNVRFYIINLFNGIICR